MVGKAGQGKGSGKERREYVHFKEEKANDDHENEDGADAKGDADANRLGRLGALLCLFGAVAQ